MKYVKENWHVLVIGLVAVFIAIIFGLVYGSDNGYLGNIAAGAAGSAWDVVLIIIVLGVFEQRRSKYSTIEKLRRKLEDFKKLDDAYGRTMIGSALRELAILGITDIDFTGIRLSHFSFSSDHGIHDLKGSKFSHGASVRQYERWSSDLEYVSFSNVDCTDVIFGNGNLSLCHVTDCDFSRSTLHGATFKGVFLKCSEDMLKRDERDWFEEMGQAEDGSPLCVGPIYTPMFRLRTH